MCINLIPHKNKKYTWSFLIFFKKLICPFHFFHNALFIFYFNCSSLLFSLPGKILFSNFFTIIYFSFLPFHIPFITFLLLLSILFISFHPHSSSPIILLSLNFSRSPNFPVSRFFLSLFLSLSYSIKEEENSNIYIDIDIFKIACYTGTSSIIKGSVANSVVFEIYIHILHYKLQYQWNIMSPRIFMPAYFIPAYRVIVIPRNFPPE